MNNYEKINDVGLPSSDCAGTERFFADPDGTEFAVWSDREASGFRSR